MIVEDQLAVFESIFKVAIDGAVVHCVGDAGECKVVGAYDADGVVGDEAAHDELRSGEAIVGVCAGEQLVEPRFEDGGAAFA